ncbi:MAG: hypothetical protein IPF46_00970 [Saprospiraceae bacterium]|nr:hypothetical protein [Candidatus Vicinibacter affinis]
MSIYRVVIIVSFIFVCRNFEIIAQNLPIVGVPTFAFVDPVTPNLANQVTEYALSLLKNSGRYTIVDMTSEDQRKIALDRAKENYKSENWIDSYKAMNAEVILSGEITSIKFVKINHDFQPGYRAAITLTLKLIEVETSKILASTNIATKTSELRLSPETALASSLDGINENILSFFNENLSQVFPILKINEIKKDQVLNFTCQIPTVLKMEIGKKFHIVHYELLGGKRIPQIIGEAKISKHIAEDFWLMAVVSGNKELFKYKDQLTEIICSGK